MKIVVIAAAAAALATAARAEVIVHGPAGPAAEVIAAEQAYSAQFAKEGLAKGFRAFLDPKDGLAFTGEGDPKHVADTYKAMGGDAAGGPTLSWEPAEVFVSKGGDMAASWGRYTMTIPNAPKAGHGRYVTVWRKSPQGQWLAIMDIGQPDPPAR